MDDLSGKFRGPPREGDLWRWSSIGVLGLVLEDSEGKDRVYVLNFRTGIVPFDQHRQDSFFISMGESTPISRDRIGFFTSPMSNSVLISRLERQEEEE